MAVACGDYSRGAISGSLAQGLPSLSHWPSSPIVKRGAVCPESSVDQDYP